MTNIEAQNLVNSMTIDSLWNATLMFSFEDNIDDELANALMDRYLKILTTGFRKDFPEMPTKQ